MSIKLDPALVAQRVRALAARTDVKQYSDDVIRAIGIDPNGDPQEVSAAMATYLAARIDIELMGRDPHDVAVDGPSNEARLYLSEQITAASKLLGDD